MRSRLPAEPVPETSVRREPSLARDEASQAPRLVLPHRPAIRAAAAPRIELRAGERAVVASSIDAPVAGAFGKIAKRLGLAALGLLALVGAVELLRPFVGL